MTYVRPNGAFDAQAFHRKVAEMESSIKAARIAAARAVRIGETTLGKYLSDGEIARVIAAVDGISVSPSCSFCGRQLFTYCSVCDHDKR